MPHKPCILLKLPSAFWFKELLARHGSAIDYDRTPVSIVVGCQARTPLLGILGEALSYA